MSNSLELDIEQLQMKVAFQEDTIETLNKALADQQLQLDRLTFQMQHVVEKMKEVQVLGIASEEEETPPPHY